MITREVGKLEISKDAAEMLESMPQEIAISTMISLAANMIRMKKGELKGDMLPDDPVMLVAEMAAMIALQSMTRRLRKEEVPAETVDKAKVH